MFAFSNPLFPRASPAARLTLDGIVGGLRGTGGSPGTAPVTIVHGTVPGRLRIRVAPLRGSDTMRRTLVAGISALEGIHAVSANVVTASVLLTHDPTRSPLEYLARIEAILASHRESTVPATAEPAPMAPVGLPAPRPGVPAARGGGTAWHLLPTELVLQRLGTPCAEGLSSQEAGRRLSRYGPNALPAPAPRSSLAILAGQFKSLPVILLGASALLSVATGGLLDAIVILAVIALNAGIGFATESASERTIAALTGGERRHAPVLRDGMPRLIWAEEVVPGDLLLPAPGTFVSADARVLEAHRLTVDESALTGESLPVTKTAAALHGDLPLADRTNMVYMGTVVMGGSARAVAVGTGERTEVGAIQALVAEARPPETPMQRQLDRLGNQMVWLSLGICGAVFGIGLLRGLGALPMLKAAVSLAVAAVPEGLPTVATTTLALGLRAMRRRHALIRHLEAVESLGAVQVICLDKTGTLTVNRMTVLALHAGDRRYDPESLTPRDLQEINEAETESELARLIQVAVLCNETDVKPAGSGFALNGTATESALVRLAITARVPVAELRARLPLLHTEYRAEGRSYMRTLHDAGAGRRLIAVKGNPAEVLALCDARLCCGAPQPLGEAERDAILMENDRMAGEALRVLGFAYAWGGAEFEAEPGCLTWLGLVGMADPVRPGTPELVRRFHDAGIRTAMITGDQSGTAYAVARRLGLSGGQHIELLDSTELERIEPQVMGQLAQRVDVFSRVSPAHKLQIVRGLQRAGRVVAMTGDGVNDGPALKAADIGVAMGSAGTEVAHSVADVVLEDDHLETMIVAIAQGRSIHDNIRKSIHFLLSTNLSEIGVTLTSVAAGFGQPVNTMQLLWINLLSDVFPALALAMEPPEPDVLRRPPRDPSEPIVGRHDLVRFGAEALLITAGSLGSLGTGVLRYGPGARASTMAFMSLTLAQLLHAWTCRSERHGIFVGERLPPNPYLNVALAASVGVQVLTTAVPGLRSVLGTTPLGIADWIAVLGGAAAPFVANEALKPLFARPQQARPAAVPRGAVPMVG